MNGGTTARRTVLPGTLALVLGAGLAAAQGPAPQERVAALKQSMQESQKRLRTYSDRDDGRQFQGRGKVEKAEPVLLRRRRQGPEGAARGRGAAGRPQAAGAAAAAGEGKVVANKKEEMTEYMQKAVALVRQYVPPDPA